MFRLWKQKRHGSFYSRPSLFSGLRIASVSRISNAVSPHQVILYLRHGTIYIVIYSYRRDIIHPRRRFVALPLCDTVLRCEVREHRTVTFVNAFSFGQPYKRLHWPLDSIDVFTHQPSGANRVCAKIK